MVTKMNKTKIHVLVLMMLSMVTVCSMHATVVNAENGIVVQAMLGRYRMYNSNDIFEDSVSGNVDGYLRSRYDISPEGIVNITDARIELETPLASGNFIDIQPPCDPVFYGVNYTYTWDFGALLDGQGAMVSLPTNFAVNFDPGFDCQRIWNPWITSEFVTRILTIVFTPSTGFYDFHGVHVSAQFPDTPEASLINVNSVSASPPNDQNGKPWNTWVDLANGEVNWQGDPTPGTTYYFSVDVTLQNNLNTEPIFYKPSVGIGANFDGSGSSPDVPDPKIGDDINRDGTVESSVTYSGTGAFTWTEYVQSENSVGLPWFSSAAPFMAEGKAFVKLEDEFVRGSAFLVSGPTPPIPKYVVLNVDGHCFWWETTEITLYGNMINLKCEPTTATSGDPGPAPIVLRIPRSEEGGRVTASGPGVSFTGRITKIMTPS